MSSETVGLRSRPHIMFSDVSRGVSPLSLELKKNKQNHHNDVVKRRLKHDMQPFSCILRERQSFKLHTKCGEYW